MREILQRTQCKLHEAFEFGECIEKGAVPGAVKFLKASFFVYNPI